MFSSLAQRRKLNLLDEALALVRERLPEAHSAQAQALVQQYYAGVAPEDLAEREAADLYGAAMAHWDLAKKRPEGTRKIRVYNPSLQQAGWQSTHTIVEIVTPDMPFLVDSVSMALNRQGFTLHLIIHPILRVQRDADGKLRQLLSPKAPEGGILESVMHAEIDRETDPQRLAALREELDRVLDDVRMAVEDWPAMRAELAQAIQELNDSPPGAADLGEITAFLEWLARGNFTFIGYRNHELAEQDGEEVLRIVPGSGLGILREKASVPASRSFAALPAAMKRLAHDPEPLIVTKSSSRSTVHRAGYLDHIGIKRLDNSGRVIGERRFLGLYTSAAYQGHAQAIPLLRRKVEGVIARCGASAQSYSGKALQHILDTYPRDELFQSTEDELFQSAMGILHLQERQRVRVFVRQDPYGRFVSCLSFVPRERYNTELRQRTQAILRAAFNAEEVDFTVSLSESMLARIHFIVRTRPGHVPEYDLAEIEARITEAARSWQDKLHAALIEARGEENGNDLFRRYQDAFPASYREDCAARMAVQDIERIEQSLKQSRLELSLYRPLEASEDLLRFKLYSPGSAIALSTVLPMLEHMGVTVADDRPYAIEPAGTEPVWIHDFGLKYAAGGELSSESVATLFQDAFIGIWDGTIEDDSFNRLVLRAGLSAREITVLQAYSRYLRQLGVAFSLAYMADCLSNNPAVARLLLDLFRARFDPRREGRFAAATVSTIRTRIELALEAVTSLDEDRILSAFLGLIQASLRTNYFQSDARGSPKPYLAIKLDPSLVAEMPQPRPMFEIFVYSARMEGAHLRGGKVARGGIRWSDRREDFRTEILGLMKAQMVKNAVIVPVGAKGGFVLKRPPSDGDREALGREAVACYQTLIRGLLDLTDNRVGEQVLPPRDLLRYDDDDPYLVVAADKGTASFSDIANGVALEYAFWLGDGFASGGSAGYDHKKMGITARGAWESVKQHFYELGLDGDTQDFTVVGIGDMAGDVFGNGMLMSRHIKLVGAFNHQHIFLDPNPDPQASYVERKRLFERPGSSWADYDPGRISKGGGVYSRAAKSIPLAPEVQGLLGIQSPAMIPSDLIRVLLRAPVDLLWNGGIGTFVKAGVETHAEVGDRANDNLRVNGSELRCKVIAEGGNLGITQRGRVEYALAGGRLNTDAIDNSGGVDCSDHEVNIKIALNAALRKGDLTVKQRNALLAQMTDEVASLVLRDNYRQARAISVAALESRARIEWYRRFMTALGRGGRLDRRLEALPSDEALAERKSARQGLTRPEIACLLAYAKTSLYPEILASGLADDPYLAVALEHYFPAPLVQRFATEVQEHQLRREIIATMLTNSLVNRAGITFAQRLHEVTGAGVAAITRAYMIAREVSGVPEIWDAIDGLDRAIPREVQIAMVLGIQQTIERASRWFLRCNQQHRDIASTIARYAPTVAELATRLPDALALSEKAAIDTASRDLEDQGVPASIAHRVAALEALVCALDLSELTTTFGLELESLAGIYFCLGDKLKLNWLREQVAALPTDNPWQERAKIELCDDLWQQQAHLTALVLREQGQAPNPQLLVDLWYGQNREPIERYAGTLAELQGAGPADLSMLTVALSKVRELARGGPAAGSAPPTP